MSIRRAASAFLKGYFATCRRSPKTEAAYAIDLRQFSAHAGFRQLGSIGPEDIEAWAREMKTRGYEGASIRRKVASLRIFFAYWVRIGAINSSPLSRVRLDLAPDRRLVRALAVVELRTLLASARASTRCADCAPAERFLRVRNRAAIELLFATGMRIGELVKISLDDVSSADATIVVNGKGRRQRLAVLVDGQSKKALKEYCRVRAQIGAHDGALFTSSAGRPLSAQTLAAVVSTAATGAGIARRVTPHMLRHSVATLLLVNGADIRVVQEFLGHASILTTQRYTHVSKENLRASLLATHPNLAQTRGRARAIGPAKAVA